MITARPQKNLQTAKHYFREHLGQGDYYSEGQTVRGVWFGKGAARLGLVPGAAATEAAFLRLCENQHPLTGAQLTVRRRIKDRRVFHDFVVAPPKSVSILAQVLDDRRLVEAHAASSAAALAQMEQLATTRIRKGGQVQDRGTGEVVAALFQHDTSRSLDPQLHTHFVVFNATWDAVEERWKALETRPMFDHLGFFTEVYRAELARRLQDLGYRLRHTATGFEVEGVGEDVIQRFSKRRRAILTEASRLEEELGKTVSNNGRAAIAHAIRERKLRNLSPAEVRAFQRAQLSGPELAGLEHLKAEAMARTAPAVRADLTSKIWEQEAGRIGLATAPRLQPEQARAPAAPTETARTALDFARDHLFERQSVVKRRKLLELALQHGRGQVTLPELETELARRTEFLVQDDALGTKAGLAAEKRLIALVNEGVGRCRPLHAGWARASGLNDEQREALRALLHSPDQVLALRGAAGSGKTEVLRGLGSAVAGRHETVFLAPTKSSVKALQEAGLAEAQTVQRFLTNEALQQRLQRPVLVVDEAGLLSNRQLLALAEWVQARRGRLVLAGDSRQHAGVEAGDALRVLERHSALQTVPLRQIQRQTELEYRAVVADFAAGHGARAINRLERLGAVTVLEEADRCDRAAESYVTSVRAGKSALVVCPTWQEVDAVNAAIRTRLRAAEKMAQPETVLTAHRSLKWTQAQKRDFAGYRPGLVLNFHKSTHTFQAGQSAEVLAVLPDRVIVRQGGRRQAEITRKQAACFDVAQGRDIAVAPGDRLLIQSNRKAAGLLNGQLVTVQRVEPDGAIRLDNGKCIPPDFRQFTHGHAVTSQTAQGRTVDHVVVVLNQHSLATNEKMLYVAVSRGREQVRIFCDSPDTLERAVQRPGTRQSVTELLQAARQTQTTQHRAAMRVAA